MIILFVAKLRKLGVFKVEDSQVAGSGKDKDEIGLGNIGDQRLIRTR